MLKTPFIGTKGVVASEHPLASLAGLKVLMDGGNAFDATIATSFALAVTQPHLGGLGSDFFALVYSAEKDRVFCLNSSGWAPKNISIEYIRQRGYSKMPTYGPLTVTVPGLVAGLEELHKKFGTAEFKELVSYSIDYAERGVPVYWSLARAIKFGSETFRDKGFKNNFMPNGATPNVGEVFKQKNLARVLRAISNSSPREFYEGWIAEEIVKYLNKNNGLFSFSDFADFRPEWCEPISTTYRNIKVYEIPPNSMGATTLLMLNMLEHFKMNEIDTFSEQRIKIITEIAKKAYAERDKQLGDPRFVKIDLKRFISKSFAKELLEADVQHGTNELTGGDTTYFAVADKEGNIVSAIQSLFHPFGSGVVVDSLGIPLNNRGSYFKFDGPNKLEPRKRSLHTLSALLLENENGIFAAIGTSGGDFRPQQHTLFVNNIVDYKMELWEALESPRFLWNGKQILVEDKFKIEKGNKIYKLIEYPGRTGVAQGIQVKDNVFIGFSDPRGDGIPLGF